MGHSTLHVDTAKYYGGDWAAFTWDGLQEWIRCDEKDEKEEDQEANVKLEEGEELVAFGHNKTIVNVHENWHCDKVVVKEVPDSTNKGESSADGIEQPPVAEEESNANINETAETGSQAVTKDAKP